MKSEVPSLDSGERQAPAGGVALAVLVTLYLTYYFWGGLASLALEGSGILTRYYGPHFLNAARDKLFADAAAREQERTRLGLLAGPGASRVEIIEKAIGRTARAQFGLWVTCLAFPFQAISIPLVFWLMLRWPPSRIGLTLRRFRRNLAAGVVGWLLLTPPVLALNFLITYLYGLWTTVGTQEHPLTELAEHGIRPFEEILLVAAAVVAAPVLEEMMFRGVIQRWVVRWPGGNLLALAAALAVAFWSRHEEFIQGWGQWDATFILELAPVGFVLAMLPVYGIVRACSRTSVGPGIFAASLLFAAVHSFAWPTPISLFLLALGLGYLFHRTGSLVGPMVLHALFNAVTCVVLLAG